MKPASASRLNLAVKNNESMILLIRNGKLKDTLKTKLTGMFPCGFPIYLNFASFQQAMPVFLIWAYHQTSDVDSFPKHDFKSSTQVDFIPVITPAPTPGERFMVTYIVIFSKGDSSGKSNTY